MFEGSKMMRHPKVVLTKFETTALTRFFGVASHLTYPLCLSTQKQFRVNDQTRCFTGEKHSMYLSRNLFANEIFVFSLTEVSDLRAATKFSVPPKSV